MIQMKNVMKKYTNGVIAIKDLSLTVDPGEFLYVIGPSGAGKSTLIKMLYHELVPTSGTIQVGKYDFSTMSDKDVPYFRRGIGIVFQDFKLLPRLTVYENIAYAMEVIEARDEDIKPRVLHVLKLVGLEQKVRRFPSELSGGEQQRVSIARAIVNAPDVVIADEPTGNLDPDTSDGIMDILERINADGTTIIMATHNRELVNARPHRLLEIAGGRLVRDEQGGSYSDED
ncbi:MAG: cell division ATP-binding protein FtsE [Lactobacillus sp.]|jgi:cell division transport system ATP-binding protein|uniref:Cell division ATP-binding protein FtsE n=1 Tax=Lacticaseibacillus suilingensis TaxID=2799577 RepID=A0ABW4BF91_9LACO|nr:cell division ATP-binding protein FtsE [Lacticaseibacillus suilingensis]MCI1893593.1 cell division ATP-binding protein FtsE [Lactobacillus sp.]MCI1941225.1 cell division ATP-binding protein FtsE [Lactobacillus sp.]MCI1971769.1 cell division ATP-binding protein FtsE [Lactobacillus sp.]MCI2016209.1 cell division ATP-binding protein FtsE [Lactobacillus sp.]MCI2038199.1 cell division ATP-binding protein FtsE [Lactobacillus sp.]